MDAPVSHSPVERTPAAPDRHEDGLLLVCDEIHQDLVYPGHTFVAMDVAAPEGRDWTVYLTAASKTFGTPGFRTGNMALMLLPLGGLYIAGGIAPKILPLLSQTWFLDAFRDKGRMAPLLERLPVHVVLNPKVGVLGASLEAARMT